MNCTSTPHHRQPAIKAQHSAASIILQPDLAHPQPIHRVTCCAWDAPKPTDRTAISCGAPWHRADPYHCIFAYQLCQRRPRFYIYCLLPPGHCSRVGLSACFGRPSCKFLLAPWSNAQPSAEEKSRCGASSCPPRLNPPPSHPPHSMLLPLLFPFQASGLLLVRRSLTSQNQRWNSLGECCTSASKIGTFKIRKVLD